MGAVVVPAEVQRYLERLVARLAGLLGERAVGIYGLGALAFDDYRPDHSDLDIYAVVRARLGDREKRAVAESASHRVLPCPARGLELVVISAEAVRQPGSTPRWELNLNTGDGRPDHVGLDPAAEPAHWFVLDLALAHQAAAVLLGPPAHEVIGAPDPADVRAAQAQAIGWYARHEMGPETVIAACRAWHWSHTGKFAPKGHALAWAATRLGLTRRPAAGQ
jgi:hypothetical protein